MRLKWKSVAVVAVAWVSAFGLVPSAHSATNAQAVIIATFSIGGGLGDPSTLPAAVPTTTCLPLSGEFAFIENCHVRYNSQRAVGFSTNICDDVTANIGKTDKAPASFGGCALSLSGFITGHCGQNGGQMSGVYVDSSGNVYNVDVHFNSTVGAPTGGTLSMTGHVTKASGADPQTGLFLGNFVATPPNPIFTPGQSCLDQTASHWQVTGTVTLLTR